MPPAGRRAGRAGERVAGVAAGGPARRVVGVKPERPAHAPPALSCIDATARDKNMDAREKSVLIPRALLSKHLRDWFLVPFV